MTCDHAQLAHIVESEPAADLEWNRLAVHTVGDEHGG